MNKRITALCAAAVMAFTPVTALASEGYEYTPVLPRVLGYKGLNDSSGLVKYTGESTNTDIYHQVNRDNSYTTRSMNSYNRTSNYNNMDTNSTRNYTDNYTNSILDTDTVQNSITSNPIPNYFYKNLLTPSGNETNNTRNTTTTNNTTNDTATNDTATNDTITNNTIASDTTTNNTTLNSNANNNNTTIDNTQLTNNHTTTNTVYTKPNIISSINEVNNVLVNGELPQLINLSNTEFVQRMNQKIKDAYKTIVAAGYENITTKYDVYSFANITSVVVHFNVSGDKTANSRQLVKTFVFDSVAQTEITLKQLLGDDYITFISTHINNQIAQPANKGLYFTDSNRFTTIRTNQSFYVKKGEIIIIFDEYNIAPGSTGTPMFSIPYDNTITIKLGSKEYFTDKGMNFISLSAVLRLGMDIRLVTGGTIDIISPEGAVLATLNSNTSNAANSNEIRLINGFDVAVSTEFAKQHLGVSVELNETSKELTLVTMY